MSDPNDLNCDVCGHPLTPESCFCSECGERLCAGCEYEDVCEEKLELDSELGHVGTEDQF